MKRADSLCDAFIQNSFISCFIHPEKLEAAGRWSLWIEARSVSGMCEP